MKTQSILLCGEKAEMCRCELPEGHIGPHECNCGGIWDGVIDTDSFRIIRLPGNFDLIFDEIPGLFDTIFE